MLSVYQKYLVVEHGVDGVEFSDLPYLASGRNSNLTSDDMVDLWHQGITVDDVNDTSPENITYEVTQTVIVVVIFWYLECHVPFHCGGVGFQPLSVTSTPLDSR